MLTIALTRHSWWLLVVSVYVLFESLRGLATGSTILFFRTVTRREDGYLYWWAVRMGLIAGAVCLIISVMRLAS